MESHSPIREMWERQERREEKALDRHQKERETLFENEALVIKVLQAVSGASLVAALAQSTTLSILAGRLSLLLFLTTMVLGLLAAVFAAQGKHQYKMWDVRAAAVDSEEEKERRYRRAGWYLTGMRAAIWFAFVVIGVGFLQLLAFLWRMWLLGSSAG